ncbi:MAG TPA: serine/threonine-protein kinase [Ktedonobacteraceae bacterium]|nr:serine/threonine-protein kinase [Ktedonobacteraceae bacterium]
MPDRVGQQLGNYRLVRLLGEGGFAEVYLGEHIHLGTEAAIKVLTARLTSDEIEQFRNEARTIARLKHPHIIRVLDFGVDNGTPFLVMDYVADGTLRQRFPKGTRLPPAIILPYVTQIASALQYAHDQKLIHRDIKPENMLLDGENALLSDFGIAVVAHSSRSMNTQDQVGTLPYMAPEQLQGKPRIASDQYALGIVVYEWLTGTRPFDGTSWEIVSQHFSTPPPPLREKVPNLSSEIEKVVLKALEKEYEKRFASVQEFAQVLAVAVQQCDQAIYAPTVLVKPSMASAPSPMKTTQSQVYTPLPRKTKEQWVKEGVAYRKAGRYQEAIAAYNQAIVLDSNYALAYNNRGNIYSDLKDYRLAIANFNQAISLAPNATRYANRGLAYYYLQDYYRAIQDFDRALQLDPGITWFKLERDDALWKLGRK